MSAVAVVSSLVVASIGVVVVVLSDNAIEAGIHK